MRWSPLWVILVVACATPSPNVKPWPCERIRENPEVYAELLLMRHTEEAFLWDSRNPLPDEAIHMGAHGWTDGIFHATRAWAVDMDAKCAADRALVGEPVMKKQDEPELSWWQRGWLGRLLRWPSR